MDASLTSALQSFLTAMAVAIFAVLGVAARRGIVLMGVFLDQKLGLATFTFVKDYVTTSVRYVEQSPAFKELTGPEKKKQVMDEVSAWCQTRGIPVDNALIEKMIEEAVQVMNSISPMGAALSDIGKLEAATDTLKIVGQ